MKNSKKIRRTLLASALSMVLCAALLIGATFAWFTDSVTNTGNQITAGDLKVDLVHVVGGNDVSLKDNNKEKVFTYDKWEPGYTELETLKVVNTGSLALKYQLDFAIGSTVDETNRKLADVIDVYTHKGELAKQPTSMADLTDENGWVKAGTLADLLAGNGHIAEGAVLPDGKQVTDASEAVGAETLTVALHMQEEANNDYRDLSLSDLYLNLSATQYTYETDGFGSKDYDEDAVLPDIYVSNTEDLNNAIADATDGPVVIGVTGDIGTVTFPNDGKARDIHLVGNGDTEITGTISTPKISENFSTLTVDNIKVADTATLDDAGLKEVTLKDSTIDVGKSPFIDSRNELEGKHSVKYIVTGNTFVSTAPDLNSNTFPIMTYGSWADGSVISNNQFGTEDKPIYGWAFRPMDVDNNATITVSNNVVYSSGGVAFAFYTSTSRDTDYKVIFQDNETHVASAWVANTPEERFLFMGTRNVGVNTQTNEPYKIRATIELQGNNTLDGQPVTADNIFTWDIFTKQGDVITGETMDVATQEDGTILVSFDGHE